MNSGRTVFSQLLDFVPMHEFRRCVQRYNGNHRTRSFSCWDQFLCMTFAQLTYRESLRDIEACLRSLRERLYHMGIRGTVSKSTLADANEKRDWRIYADLAQILIAIARELYIDEDVGLDLKNTVYAFDSTTIDLCMTLFPWAHFKTSQHALKIHAMLDLRGKIPTFIRITPARVHDVNIFDEIVPEPGAFYVFDRAYLDFERLYALNMARGFFVTRARKDARFRRIYSHPVDRRTGLICDQTVELVWFYPAKSYPEPLRRIKYIDPQTLCRFVFLTNHFQLPALTIAQLYRSRWHIELFFKWIKQHLRIKAFYGTSPNAVKTQIWIAICTYVLVAIAKKRLQLPHSLYAILQILSVTLFEKTPIPQAFAQQRADVEMDTLKNQLCFQGFLTGQ
jgi:transposase